MNLTVNEGMADRVVRVIGGLALLSLPFAFPDAAWRHVGWLGLIFLATGAVGTCPIYMALGWNTAGGSGDE